MKDGLQYGAGVTLTPVEGLTVRAYGSYNESVEEGEKGITNLAAFVGYKHTPSQWQRNTITRPIRNMCLIVIRWFLGLCVCTVKQENKSVRSLGPALFRERLEQGCGRYGRNGRCRI